MTNAGVDRVLWRPPVGQETEIDRFREKVNREYGLRLGMSERRVCFSKLDISMCFFQ